MLLSEKLEAMTARYLVRALWLFPEALFQMIVLVYLLLRIYRSDEMPGPFERQWA